MKPVGMLTAGAQPAGASLPSECAAARPPQIDRPGCAKFVMGGQTRIVNAPPGRLGSWGGATICRLRNPSSGTARPPSPAALAHGGQGGQGLEPRLGICHGDRQ